MEIPEPMARNLVTNIKAFRAGNPVSDEGWADMDLRLDAIMTELVALLELSGIKPDREEQLFPDNPYLTQS